MFDNRKAHLAHVLAALAARTTTKRCSAAGAALSSTALEGARLVDEPLTLGRRIFQLVWCEPFEDAIASLGMVTVSLVLAEVLDPLEALDGLAIRMREILIEAKRRDEAEHSVHQQGPCASLVGCPSGAVPRLLGPRSRHRPLVLFDTVPPERRLPDTDGRPD